MAKVKTPKSIAFKAKEFFVYKKSVLWYAGAGAIVVALELIALLLARDAIMALAILAGAGALIFHSSLEPRVLDYQMDNRGIHVGARIYDYRNINYFWFTYEPAEAVNFEVRGRMLPITIYLVGKEKEAEVRNFLAPYLTENREKQDDLVTSIIHRLKI